MSCASCSHAPCSGPTCLVNHWFFAIYCATLHMHYASKHYALCNMPHAPCPVHHAPLSLHHAILHVHHVFQKCNCHIAPTLLRGEWSHSAQSVPQGHMVHGAWAWIIGMGHRVCLTGLWCTGPPVLLGKVWLPLRIAFILDLVHLFWTILFLLNLYEPATTF